MADAPKALIVDDHPLFRDALETALALASNSLACAIHAGSIAEAMTQSEKERPDLILLDLNLADTDGFDGLARLRQHAPEAPIVIVSATESDWVFERAEALGARGYLPKSMSLNALTTALGVILQGKSWFPEKQEEQPADTSDAVKRIASLTPAQQRVINGLSDGLLNKQIAHEMGISEATVKAHMTAILRKLGANNRTQALLFYKSALELSDHSAA
ncbi:MAG: response regulator transcription factor [Pseudomonadota bacterium]